MLECRLIKHNPVVNCVLRPKLKHPLLHVAVLCALSHMAFAQSSAQPVSLSNPYHSEWKCTPYQGHWVCREKSTLGSGLYEKGISKRQHREALTHALGWIANTSNAPGNCSVCGGHYYEPPIPKDTTALKASSTKIISGQPSYQVGGSLKLTDGVVVTQPGRRLYADAAIITPDKKTKKLNSLKATGNIRLRQPGQLILGSHLKANLISHKAELNDVTYLVRVGISPQGQPLFDTSSGIVGRTPTVPDTPNFTGYAHGHADKIMQVNIDRYILTNASYSTCPPTGNAWELDASKIKLNKKTGVGTAHNVVLHFYGVPIFYTPYFNFPINDKRKTGFLYPSPGWGENTGYFLGLPFYINLAPNYDDTVTPWYYTKHGFLLDNNFRFLTKNSQGNVQFQYVPHDKTFGTSRYAYFLNDTTRLPWGFKFTGAYNYVSDSDYLQDFNNLPFSNITSFSSSPYGQSSAELANTVIIPRSAHLSRNSLHWNFNATVQSYKVIGKLITENSPYDELPAINLTGQYPSLFKPFSTSIQMGFTNFQKSGSLSSTSTLSINGSPVDGQRLYVQPTLSLPLQAVYGFLTPSISLNVAQYNLQNVADKNITRVLPIFDISSGLYFDHDFKIGNSTYTQTLEPRLFYLYVPFTSQNNIPVFDSTLNQFNFSQLFANNRFSGEDRIGDANQISAALTTNLDNAQGQDVLSASIGQIYYFERRRVSLCDNSANPNCIANEQPDLNSATSAITSLLTYHINNDWYISGNLNYSPRRHTVDYQTYQLQYKSDPRHIFNFEYQSNRFDYGLLSTQQLLDGSSPPNVSQINSSFLWALTPSWSAVGSVNFSINNGRAFSEFAGLEYDSCCWSIRFLVDHYLSATNPNTPNKLDGPGTTGVLVQFELKGLGSMGMTQIQSLLSTVPGYNPQLSGFN